GAADPDGATTFDVGPGHQQREGVVLQAEDGIRAPLVTGVQTCALPISRICRCVRRRKAGRTGRSAGSSTSTWTLCWRSSAIPNRSEQRRVGKQGAAGAREVRLTERGDGVFRRGTAVVTGGQAAGAQQAA